MRPELANGLNPEARERFLRWESNCLVRGVTVLSYQTYRSPEQQAEAYAIGRTKPGLPCMHGAFRRRVGMCQVHPMGRVITNAKPWESWHQFKCADDAVPTIGGKPDWSYSDSDSDLIPDEPWWRIMVEEADKLGIEWAGRWKTFREFCHWQVTGGKTLAQLRAEMGIVLV